MSLKKILVILTVASLALAGCNQSGGGVDARNDGLTPEHDESLQIPHPDNNTDNETDNGNIDQNPENPENPLPPVEPDDEVVQGKIEYGDNGIDKYAGDGSYIDERHPEKMAYYDDINGVPRDIPNNLVGDLYGGIQFIQSHNIAPSGNGANARPTLVPYRIALLTLTTDVFYKSIKAEVKTKGNTYIVDMDSPRNIPLTESKNRGKQFTFSNKSWSFSIPEKYVAPGMEITFTATDEEDRVFTGKLPAESVEYSTPTEVTYFNIRLGMLTDPPAMNSNLYMLSEPARAMADYFQTMPFGRVVNVTYEPRKLPIVIIQNGTVYDMSGTRGPQVSNTNNADYYNGDMRQAVAKVEYSAGVNLANRGISSSAINESADNHQNGKDPLYMAIHHAQGKYKNGLKMHGLSGGNGMFTLTASIDNEFSHELGHGYGLGHYVDGGWTTSGVVHGYDTGWGYDSYKNKIRGNIAWGSISEYNSYNGMRVPTFKNTYSWNWDTMSGGWAGSDISRYTYLTARTTKYVQDFAKDRYTLSDTKDENGYYNYVSWDRKKGEYVNVKDINPDWLANRPSATERGVPVFTILGGYNPDNNTQAVVYQYFRANYGHVFGDLFKDEAPASGTYLKIEYWNSNKVKYVELSDVRHNNNVINKIHVNIAESSKPKKVTLYIKGQTRTDLEGYYTDIPENLEPMNAPAIIGKDYGYESLILAEIAELTTALESSSVDRYTLTTRQEEIIDNLIYNKAIDRLTGNTKGIVDDYLSKQNALNSVNLFIDKNYKEISSGDEAVISELKKVAEEAGYTQTEYTPVNMTVNNGVCIGIVEENDKKMVKGITCDSSDKSQQWFMDMYSRIRSVSNPDLCINSEIENNGLVKCGDNTSFFWVEDNATNEKTSYINMATNKCLDYSTNERKIITWDCNGGANQKFSPKLQKAESPYKNTSTLVFNGYKCLQIRDNKTQNFSNCDSVDTANDISYQWFIDRDGKIHSAKYPLYCIQAPSYLSTIEKCSNVSSQKWIKYENEAKQYYKNQNVTSKCMGYDGDRNLITIWDCSQKSINQHVKYLPVEENKGIITFDSSMLEYLDNILANK